MAIDIHLRDLLRSARVNRHPLRIVHISAARYLVRSPPRHPAEGIVKIKGRIAVEPEYWLKRLGSVSWWRLGRV